MLRLGESKTITFSSLVADASLVFESLTLVTFLLLGPSISNRVCKHILRGHTSTIRCLKVLDGRPVAVSGSRDSTLRVWDIEKGVLLHLLSGHQHSVRCIEVAGNKVVSGSYDCTCRVSRVSFEEGEEDKGRKRDAS